jgi:hypothetical protein
MATAAAQVHARQSRGDLRTRPPTRLTTPEGFQNLARDM